MLYFIHDNEPRFKLDFTHLKPTFNEENPWFQDEIESEWSFPFDMSVQEWIRISDFSNYNATGPTQFAGRLTRDGVTTSAKLKIQTHVGDKVSGIIFAGVSQLPFWDTQLKDLPLERFEVENLKTHALTVLNLSYPEVNYCFDQLHTDKYDPESHEFNGFEKVINQYYAGAFIENILELETNIDQIRNIMQPFPFLMHVIQAPIIAAGFTLQGDILHDDDLRKAVIIRDGEYYKSISREQIPFRLRVDEYLDIAFVLNGRDHMIFVKDLVVEAKGDYILFGDILCVLYYSLGLGVSLSSTCSVLIEKISGGVSTILLQGQFENESDVPGDYKTTPNVHVDIEVSFESGDILRLTKIEPRRDQVPSETPDYPDAVYLDLIPIRFRNPDGSPIISLLDLNEVNLSLTVPDMTWGEMVNTVRKLKNLNFVQQDNVIIMDYITPKLNRSTAVDFTTFEIPEPQRTFQDERTYELFFADGRSNKDYIYDSYFIAQDGVKINDYKKDKNTKEISIDALPLPVITRNGLRTAYALDNESSKLRLAFHRAMQTDAQPVFYENSNMLISGIYRENYGTFLDFLIRSIGHQWEFIISVEKMRAISTQSVIYAYKNFHLLSSIEKERISHLWWRISMKSESF